MNTVRNDVIEHIGSCIWEARRHKGYSRRVLSEKTGLSERTIEKIEKGKVNTTAETLYTLIMLKDISIRRMKSSIDALHFPMQIRLSVDWSRMKPVRLY